MTVPSTGRLIGRPSGASLVEREVRTGRGGVEAGRAGEGSFALGLCPDQSRQINHLPPAEVLAKDNLAYYNATRPHQALHNNSPHPSEVQAPEGGRIVAIPQVGGLHHRYQRAA